MKFIIDTEDVCRVRSQFRAEKSFYNSLTIVFQRIDPEIRFRHNIDDPIWTDGIATYSEELGERIRAAEAKIRVDVVVFPEDVTFQKIKEAFDKFYGIDIVRTDLDFSFDEQ